MQPAKVVVVGRYKDKTIRQLCLDQNVLPAAELDELLDPDSMTRPTASASSHRKSTAR